MYSTVVATCIPPRVATPTHLGGGDPADDWLHRGHRVLLPDSRVTQARVGTYPRA